MPGQEALRPDAVSPVWVFWAERKYFERLVQLVNERRRDRRLFSRVQADRAVDRDCLRAILSDPPEGYPVQTRAPQLVKEAKRFGEGSTDEVARGVSDMNINVEDTQNQKPINVGVSQQPEPAFGLNVDSLMGEFLLFMNETPLDSGLFFF